MSTLADITHLTIVTEGIYKLFVHFPFGMRQVNCYLFQGEKGFTVVDTGSRAPESIGIWENVLNTGLTVEKVILTHAHPDHIGLAGWFQENYHVPVYISSLGYKEIQKTRRDKDGIWISNLFQSHGGPAIPGNMLLEASAYEFEPDGTFENHQEIKLGNEVYEAIWTSGHAPDHFCFYNHKQQVMVVGDHILNEISPIIAVWSAENKNPLQDYFEALEKVKGYPTKLALPGHGEIIENLDKRIDELISSHNHRLEQVLNSVRNEAKTSYQVCNEIYGELSIHKFFAPLMATISRFAYLEENGKVKSEFKNGKIYYQLTQS